MIAVKKTKLIIFISFTVVCIVIIFLFSAQPRTVSSANSLNLLTAIAQFINRVFHLAITDRQIVSVHNFFRKTAHFTVYAILGILSYNTFRLAIEQRKRAVIFTFIFCVVAAIADEIHQIFVPGRSAEVRDVCIDTLGVCFGLCLVWAVNVIIKIVKKIRIKKQIK